MKSIVGKVINSKIIKKSNKGDWYVLESPIRNRNIFLHISNWNSNPNLNEGDYLAVYVVGFDGNKNRYNGSLKTKDSIYSLIDQIESTMLITSDEKNALLSLDYSSFVEQIDRLRDFLLFCTIHFKKSRELISHPTSFILLLNSKINLIISI